MGPADFARRGRAADVGARRLAAARGRRNEDPGARAGCVAAIDKTLPAADADGENVGIAKFGAAGAALLVEQMNQIVGAGGVRDWLPRAFAAFARRRPLHVVETRGYPWTEIDYPDDYRRACADVLPAIDDARAARAAAHGDGAGATAQVGRTVRHV